MNSQDSREFSPAEESRLQQMASELSVIAEAIRIMGVRGRDRLALYLRELTGLRFRLDRLLCGEVAL